MKSPTFISLISVDAALQIHDMAIVQFGGREGVLSLALLESALGHVSMVIEYGTEEENKIFCLATEIACPQN